MGWHSRADFLDEGEVRIRGRNGMDFTKQFPELLTSGLVFPGDLALFDGEIVCLEAMENRISEM